MGKVTGFLEIPSRDREYEPVSERVGHFHEFIVSLDDAVFVTDGRYREQSAEQLGAAGCARPGRVAHDHGLAATEVEPGEGRLVGHAAGEVEHVGEGVGGRGVRQEPGAAEGRTEGGGVDRDDGAQAGLRILGEDDLLVLGGRGEDVGAGGRGDGGLGHG